jgi:hypothetical protein
MSSIELKFTFDAVEELDEFNDTVLAVQNKYVISTVREEIRQRMKHGELTDAEYNQLEWVQTLIREALST